MQTKLSATQIIFSVLVVIALVGWFVINRTKHVPAPVATAPETILPTGTQWPSVEVKKETFSDSNQYYTIDAAYPLTADPRISDGLKSFIDDQIAQFKSDTSWATDPSISSASEGTLSLSIDYKEQKSKNADVYIFSISTYTGGAHGLQFTRTFNYDQNGKVVALAELFTNGEKGLETIAPFVQKAITAKKISDADWIKDGTAPTLENYQSFVISDEGVTFIFDAYQVAPYAAGTQSILVPITAFKSIANPQIFTK